MYEIFFGFNSKPFDLLPNPDFLFLSQSHRRALNYLEYGLKEKSGFILLTGEVGSGKTTIIRDIVNRLHKDSLVSMVFNTLVSSRQLLAMINEDFGLETSGKDKVTLLRELNFFLIDQYSKNTQPIVIIDEGQNLTREGLEEVRLLSNLEADNFKLLQIVLVGQPELKEIISDPALRQLRQRINVNCHLSPLSREETEQYIYHRLECAGNRDAVKFFEGTFDVIFQYSSGIPRLINSFCDFLLLTAFVEETHDLTLQLVRDVVAEVAGQPNDVPNTSLIRNTKSFQDRDIEERLSQLEKGFSSLRNMLLEQDDLLKRISGFENVLGNYFKKQEKYLFHLEEGLKHISTQIVELRRPQNGCLDTNLKKQNTSLKKDKKKHKKGLLGWMFG